MSSLVCIFKVSIYLQRSEGIQERDREKQWQEGEEKGRKGGKKGRKQGDKKDGKKKRKRTQNAEKSQQNQVIQNSLNVLFITSLWWVTCPDQ